MSEKPIQLHTFDELLTCVAQLSRGIIAIDGPCASGKSTLAARLGEALGANVFHMDDFFLRPAQRTPERLSEPGGNVDRERFFLEVLAPLAKGVGFAYQPYDCGEQALAAPVAVVPTALSVVEGAYSLHPALRDAYALGIFLSVDPVEQRARILRRNGPELAKRFDAEWIPMENAYFAAFRVREFCDFTLTL